MLQFEFLITFFILLFPFVSLLVFLLQSSLLNPFVDSLNRLVNRVDARLFIPLVGILIIILIEPAIALFFY